MRPLFRPLLITLFAAGLALPLLTRAEPPAAPDLAWPVVTRENKPWIRWWWPGCAVDRPNLTRELEAMAAAGFGGVEITPIYGVKGEESRFIPFLSPAYVQMLAHAATEARRLGLAVDMNTGTGWPFGGPKVESPDAELKLTFGPDGSLIPVPTQFMVKRSAPGGEGLVLNPYSAAAMRHYLATFTSALAPLPPGTLHSQFHDSFEYEATWAAEVDERFAAVHGYDLRAHAAELNGRGDPDTVARIKADYRTTLGALHLDYMRAWVDWAHQRGEQARNQAHGSPGNLLDLYAVSDIPETEIFGSGSYPIPGFRREPTEIGPPGPLPIFYHFASSAAHVMGRPYASSETFTWLREHFHEAPSEMKPELDTLFLAGINHIFYHGNAYSPAGAPWPGWLFYASTQANLRNPLWPVLGDGLNAYISRVQSLLQAGAPDNDLLVYWPADDLWHNPEGQLVQLTPDGKWLETSPTGGLMIELNARGYAYDLISDLQLRQTAVDAGGLKTPGGHYRAILVPPTGHMENETLRRLLALATDGATVLFAQALPADVPGYGNLAERRAQFRADLDRLPLEIAPGGLRQARLGQGRVVVGPLAALLASAGISKESLPEAGLQCLRRSTGEGYVYFLANLTGQPVDRWVRLGRPAQSAVQLDPRGGDAGVAKVRQQDGSAEIYLQLAPGESALVRTYTGRPAAGRPLRYYHPGTPIPLTGEWRVTPVRGGPELPPAFAAARLGSWTAQGGEWERFAGTARYQIDPTLPAGAQADAWRLDLGDVRETARVFINGIETDLVWSLPFQTKIGAHLKPGKNTIALEVTNLAANRIRDLDRRKVEWKKFYDINFVNILYEPLDASAWPLQPSGLLGPVQLVPLQAFEP